MNLELSLALLFIGSLSALVIGRRAFAIIALSSVPVFMAANGELEGEIIPFLPTTFRVDALSSLFLMVLAVVILAVSLYGLVYPLPRFTVLGTGMAFLSALLFLVTDNIERLTLAYELFVVFTGVMLLGFNPRRAWRYLVVQQVFGIIPLLVATGLAYGAVGDLHHLTFHALHESLTRLPVKGDFLLVLFLLAALVRSGVFPLHSWVTKVYSSVPSPLVPVLIFGEALGFYLLLRVSHFALPAPEWLGYLVAFLGSVSTFSTLYSFREVRLKRKFARHSVMDVGIAYFALGVSIVLQGTFLGTVALLGALLHILYQVIYKGAVYFGLGAIEYYGENPTVCSLRRLLRGHVVALLITLSAFSLAAVPPLSAFMSRWLVYMAPLGTGDVLLWLMAVAVAFSGLFPLASIIQVRRINRLICRGEVEREELPLAIRAVTGGMAFLGFVVSVFPFLLLPWLKASIEELHYPLPESPVALFFAHPSSAIALTFLLGSLFVGLRVGRLPTERVSELLLIFYSIGDLLRSTVELFLDGAKSLYIAYVLPVIKVVPRYEVPVIRDYDDALDYPVRHLDEAMFMPLIRFLSKDRFPERDMTALMLLLVTFLGLIVVAMGVVG